MTTLVYPVHPPEYTPLNDDILCSCGDVKAETVIYNGETWYLVGGMLLPYIPAWVCLLCDDPTGIVEGKAVVCRCGDGKGKEATRKGERMLLVNDMLLPYIPVGVCVKCGEKLYFTVKRKAEPCKQNGGIEG